jgi:hypothetical protein
MLAKLTRLHKLYNNINYAYIKTGQHKIENGEHTLVIHSYNI